MRALTKHHRFKAIVYAVTLALALALAPIGALAQTSAATDPIEEARSALAARPSDHILRAELGYLLIQAERLAEAQYHFEWLVAREADVARRNLYAAVLRRIQSERPAGLGVIFNITPSTNLNGGTSEETLVSTLGGLGVVEGEISEESRAQGGWRGTFGLTAFLRTPLGARQTLRFDTSASRTLYSNALVEDEDRLAGTLTWSRRMDWGQIALSLGQSAEIEGDERITRTRLGFAGRYRLETGGTYSWALAHTKDDYRLSTGQSGHDRLASLRRGWSFGEGASNFVGLQLEWARPDLAHQRYDGQVLQIGGRRLWGPNTAIDVTLSLGLRDFEGDFPGQSFPREDRVRALNVAVQNTRLFWRGFSPKMTCQFQNTGSNIALYEADVVECGVSLARQF